MISINYDFGEISDNFRFGYGYCQCGCGDITSKYSDGTYRKYLPFHKNKKGEYQTYKGRRINKEIVTKEFLYWLYHEENNSIYEIADLLNCSESNARRLLKENEIESRSQSKARLNALKKGKISGHDFYEIDESFFSDWTPEMAWVLGLIYTDGYMKGNNMRLAMNDLDVIEKVIALLNYSKPVKVLKHNKKKLYSVEFHRELMAKDLLSLGVHQAKSFSLEFPDMPNEMKTHFIRGCWDGDGGISISNNKISAYYTSGSEKFITVLSETLFENGIYRNKIRKSNNYSFQQRQRDLEWFLKYQDGIYPCNITKRKTGNAFDIRIGLPISIINLQKYLYSSATKGIYMDRKYNKFREAINILKI